MDDELTGPHAEIRPVLDLFECGGGGHRDCVAGGDSLKFHGARARWSTSK